MAIASINNPGSTSARRSVRSIKSTTSSTVVISSNQIDDARRYLSDNLHQDDLNPTNLARGGRDKVIGILREAANNGQISNIPRNPSDQFLRALYNNTVGLGVLEEFLANPEVEQINVQGPQKILLQIRGIWTEVTDPELLFKDVKELRMVAANIARRVGKELSRHTNPIIDIRFENPVLRIHINQTRRIHGIAVYIRRGRDEPFSTDFLLEAGNFNREVLKVLQDAARRLIGCVFLGGVGSGKTVMLEKYIDWMPNIPIVIVDDAGDCQPSHPMCAIFDLPETSYTSGKQVNLTLGGMTRAALREGDVLIVAETRSAEEAGILISDAPSMRCVVTTAHGDTAPSGLSRLVSIAQRPPSPYAGTNSLEALRRDLAQAFPLVIQVDRRGNRRFVSGIYHNLGWSDELNQWQLRTIVEAEVTDEKGIEWHIVDPDLNKVKQFVSLDMMQTGRATVYESKNPQRMLADALRKVDEQKWVEAIHLLSILLKNDPSNEQIRHRLIQSIEQTDDYENILTEARQEVERLNQLTARHIWGDARRLIKDLPKRPSVYAFVWRLHSNMGQIEKIIEEGYQETSAAMQIMQEANELLRSHLPWTELRRCLSSLQSLDVSQLSDETKAGVKFAHANLLVELVRRAPKANGQFYRQQLDAFIGKEEANRRLGTEVIQSV